MTSHAITYAIGLVQTEIRGGTLEAAQWQETV